MLYLQVSVQPLEGLMGIKIHDTKINLYLPVPFFTHTQAQ